MKLPHCKYCGETIYYEEDVCAECESKHDNYINFPPIMPYTREEWEEYWGISD